MPSLQMKAKDQEFFLECSSSAEFDSVTYSQYDSPPMKFSTSTPTKTVTFDVSNSDDVEVEMERKVSTVSTVSTASLFSNSSKNISSIELDNDVIEQLQICNGRVWDRKYVCS